jgi:hypothetical protein
MVTPVGQDVQAIPKVPGESIELPDHDRLDAAIEDVPLQLLEARTVQVVTGSCIFIPLGVLDAMRSKPTR